MGNCATNKMACTTGCYYNRPEEDLSVNGELRIERIASQQEIMKKVMTSATRIQSVYRGFKVR